MILLLVIRFYSFHLLRRVLTGSAAVPPLPLPSRGVILSSVQGVGPKMEFAGAGAAKGRGPLLVDVWKGDKGEGKLDKLHLRVHLALVEAAGFGSTAGNSNSSNKPGGSNLEEDEEELSRAANRLLEAFGAGTALRSATSGRPASPSTPKDVAETSETETLNGLEVSADEIISLLTLARPLVTFTSALGAFGQSPGGMAGFRRGSDFRAAGRSTATGASRWGSTTATEPVLTEDDYEDIQASLARLASQSGASSVLLFTSPAQAQGSIIVSLGVPEIERTPHEAFLSPSPSMGRTLGSYGATPRPGGQSARRGSTASFPSPTMSPSMDVGGGTDYFALEMVLEEPSEGSDIDRTEKEVM